ncbi:hypothetical protein K456DRAFT_410093 [Colletotrichum gloeosporioides 23]|nr:hypothetical protein K456DRAFT_410093 [Colletotrichum gloeosporioides 23]
MLRQVLALPWDAFLRGDCRDLRPEAKRCDGTAATALRNSVRTRQPPHSRINRHTRSQSTEYHWTIVAVPAYPPEITSCLLIRSFVPHKSRQPPIITHHPMQESQTPSLGKPLSAIVAHPPSFEQAHETIFAWRRSRWAHPKPLGEHRRTHMNSPHACPRTHAPHLGHHTRVVPCSAGLRGTSVSGHLLCRLNCEWNCHGIRMRTGMSAGLVI